MNMPILLPFNDPQATEVALSGGKGASLARLSVAGFPVPEGVIITAQAYRDFIAADAQLPGEIAALDFKAPEMLRCQCEAIRHRLIALPLPVEMLADFRAMLPPLLALGPVSVRSSSTLEDLAGAAFAGQHDTYLNVHGLDDVMLAVRRCFASLWEDRAVRYRHERGFGQDRQAMAVVIQRMVPSEVAGVGFCLNPISGDPSQIVINAAWGLGEIVVSGEGNVDQFIVEKATGWIVEQVIAEKTHEIRSAQPGMGSGTAMADVDPKRRKAPSLGAEQLEALRRLCLDVERFYGFPQDIEWGLAGGRLYLLQSRPVTQFPSHWTRDESAERFPNVITPLAWDFDSDGFHESLAHSLRLLGLPPFEGHWFERFDDYIYGNQTAVQLFTSGRQYHFDSLDQLRAMIPGFREHNRWVQQLPVSWARDLDFYLLSLGALQAAPLQSMSERELWEHILKIDALGRGYFRPNIAISIAHGVLHRTLFRLIGMIVPDPAQAAALYDGLTCFCETKTNLVNRDLHELYRIARQTPPLAALLQEEDRRKIWEEGLLAEYAEFRIIFAKFLQDHGHREVDFDAYIPTWSGQPWVVLENIRLMLLREEVQNPAERERQLRVRQQQAEHTFLAAVPDDLRFFASEIIRLARAYTALDDLEHYQTTRLSVPFRKALVELGCRLAEHWVLTEPEDIFFLHKATLAAAMEGERTDEQLTAEAHANKAAYLAHKQQPPPWVYGEMQAETPGAQGMKGLPGSPGCAEGPVCRVFGVEDFHKFPSGAVLVARTTNPAWTALFYSASAVITESGGPLSHGAVTAREVGLPAVMCVHSALSMLHDGQRVRVNGTAGIVTPLEDARD